MSNNRLPFNKEFYITVSMIIGIVTLTIITLITVISIIVRIYIEKPPEVSDNPIDTNIVNEALEMLNLN